MFLYIPLELRVNGYQQGPFVLYRGQQEAQTLISSKIYGGFLLGIVYANIRSFETVLDLKQTIEEE